MVPVTHRLCGELAFWYEQDQLRAGATALSKFGSHLDGTQIEACTVPVCDSCGRVIRFDSECLDIPYAADGD